MDSPFLSYKQNLKNSNYRKESKTLFIDKYIKDIPEKNPFKLNENFLAKKSKKLIPGKIYTFVYDPLYKDVLSYYDKRPILLLHSVKKAKTDNDIISGINLNFLPEKVKVTLLNQFYVLFKSEIDKDIDNIWENKLSFIMKAITLFKNWLQTKRIFEKHPNINFSFAYRNYIISRMDELKLIEYDDWEILPFLESKEIIGASLIDIYNSYKDSFLKK